MYICDCCGKAVESVEYVLGAPYGTQCCARDAQIAVLEMENEAHEA